MKSPVLFWEVHNTTVVAEQPEDSERCSNASVGLDLIKQAASSVRWATQSTLGSLDLFRKVKGRKSRESRSGRSQNIPF